MAGYREHASRQILNIGWPLARQTHYPLYYLTSSINKTLALIIVVLGGGHMHSRVTPDSMLLDHSGSVLREYMPRKESSKI